MKGMHFFKQAKQDEIPSPIFDGDAVARILLEFLSDVREWSMSIPCFLRGMRQENDAVYILYRDAAFVDSDFWNLFGGYLTALRKRWRMDVFGTDFSSQETVWLALEERNNRFYATQRSVSGQPSETLHTICLRIQCFSPGEAERIYSLCQAVRWQNGVVVVDWKLRDLLMEERISYFCSNTRFCYGRISENPTTADYLEALNFEQKVLLWSGFLIDNFDYAEFEWLYEEISGNMLKNKMEWELALNTAFQKLNYTMKISEAAFELYDGQGKRCYFNFDSRQSSQRAFLKMLFPVNL